MTLGTAVILLAAAMIGMVVLNRYLRKKRMLRRILMVLLSLLALFCAVYIGLTIFFVYAVSVQPPVQRV